MTHPNLNDLENDPPVSQLKYIALRILEVNLTLLCSFLGCVNETSVYKYSLSQFQPYIYCAFASTFVTQDAYLHLFTSVAEGVGNSLLSQPRSSFMAQL